MTAVEEPTLRRPAGRPVTGLRVFIDAANVVSHGSAAIVTKLLPALAEVRPEWLFAAVTPDRPAFDALPRRANMEVMPWRRAPRGMNGVVRLGQLHLRVPRAVRRWDADVLLTLGGVGSISAAATHVVFLHLAHLVYPRDVVAGHDVWSPLQRRYMEWQFGRTLDRGATVVVQTPVMAQRLEQKYGPVRAGVHSIAQPHTLRADDDATEAPALAPLRQCRRPIRLLFPAADIAHKNHAVLPAVVRELRRRGRDRDVGIFVTLDPLTRAVRERLQWSRNEDVLCNLGQLSSGEMAAAYRSSTALFMPTLLESYGLPYVEAMAFGKPILTSDRDFARWMCGDLAVYFDPLDAASIVDAIETSAAQAAFSTRRANARLETFPRDWSEVARGFCAVIETAVRDGQR